MKTTAGTQFGTSGDHGISPKTSSNKEKSGRSPLSVAGNALSELMTFLEICIAGLNRATEARRVLSVNRMATKVVGGADPYIREDQYSEAAKRAQKLEAFAKAEERHGFPYLYGLASTRLWSILEALADDLVAYLLRVRPACREIEIIKRLEGPLVEFVSAKEADKAKYLAELLAEHVKVQFKLGVGRFEAVFNAVGLGGPVEADVRRALLELSQIRDVIIHCEGRVDARLLTNCPWLEFKNGQRLRITQHQFRKYYLACFWYLLELDRRLAKLLGRVPSEYKSRIHHECLRELQSLSQKEPSKRTGAVGTKTKKDDQSGLSSKSETIRHELEKENVSALNELRDILLKEDREELNKSASTIQKSKSEKQTLFAAYAILGKMVSDLLEARLIRPGTWLEGAPYLSKIKLGVCPENTFFS